MLIMHAIELHPHPFRDRTLCGRQVRMERLADEPEGVTCRECLAALRREEERAREVAR